MFLTRLAVLALAAAELKTALSALPRLVSPLHRRTATEAALEGGLGFLRTHQPDSTSQTRRVDQPLLGTPGVKKASAARPRALHVWRDPPLVTDCYLLGNAAKSANTGGRAELQPDIQVTVCY